MPPPSTRNNPSQNSKPGKQDHKKVRTMYSRMMILLKEEEEVKILYPPTRIYLSSCNQ